MKTLGLTEREASVYLTLLVKGAMKAGEIARELKMYRLDAYNILKVLQEKEMVEATLSRPMLFKATSLDSVLDMLNLKQRENVRKSTEALTELEEVSKRLSQLLESENEGRDGATDKLQILSGRKMINERWFRLLSSAEHEILIAATERDTAQFLLSRVLDVISAKIKAGVKVNVYTPVTKSNAEQFLTFREQIRHLTVSSSAGLCIIDRRRAMMVLVSPRELLPALSKREETAVLIESRSIGEILGTLFFVGWDTSPVIEDVIGAIKRD